MGIDFSEERLAYAGTLGNEELQFRLPGFYPAAFDDLGEFDFVWIRFVLEYYRAEACSIVRACGKVLKPGGILCLIDLDYNCMTHFEMPERLEETTQELIEMAEIKANFDPYAGKETLFIPLQARLHRYQSSCRRPPSDLRDLDRSTRIIGQRRWRLQARGSASTSSATAPATMDTPRSSRPFSMIQAGSPIRQ